MMIPLNIVWLYLIEITSPMGAIVARHLKGENPLY